ncbi:hypothetical protein GGR58DRAFT_490763 [Xylaria digitata]|nr:hypothetical protein GGR58DRAFT_490763 [Xylaria digitata]
MHSPRQHSPTTPEPMSIDEPPIQELPFVGKPSSSRTVSNSGSNSGDRHEDRLYDVPSWPKLSLETTGDLAGEANELAEVVLGNFLPTASSLACGTKGGSSAEQPQTSWFENRVEIEQKSDTDDEDAVIISSPSLAEHHLLCPYYVRQKNRYQSCLTRFDLREIEDLELHLQTEHRQPTYCPTCGDTFSSSRDWKEHVRRRSCVLSGKPPPEGITVLQMQKLAQLDDAGVSRELQWRLIWEIIFPGAKSPSLPLPSGGIEAAVWLQRDFWSAEGDRIVSSFLNKRRPRDREPNSMKLGSLVLNIVIDRLVERFKQEDSG